MSGVVNLKKIKTFPVGSYFSYELGSGDIGYGWVTGIQANGFGELVFKVKIVGNASETKIHPDNVEEIDHIWNA